MEFEDVDNINYNLHEPDMDMDMTLDAWEIYKDKKCIPWSTHCHSLQTASLGSQRQQASVAGQPQHDSEISFY